MFPISDWRVLCTADADECNRLFEMGVMNYTGTDDLASLHAHKQLTALGT